MVRQVLLQERVLLDSGSTSNRIQLAFGDHPDIDAEADDRQVTQAVASQNRIRIVFDELLVGNNIEELACADGTFSRVPLDADPDDIADCSPPNLQNCTSVCQGPPVVGILDENEDGAADDRRMIAYGTDQLAVTLDCAGTNIPMEPVQSFYQPSGNQQITAGPLEEDSLGPAIILVPTVGLRTGATCQLVFNDAVVDKDGNRVCAPENGDITRPCSGAGVDITFGVEALGLIASDPSEGQTGVSGTDLNSADKTIVLQFNAQIDPASVAGAFTVTENGTDISANVTATVTQNSGIVSLEIAGGIGADSDVVITMATSLVDIFGGALPQNFNLNFTTGAGAGVDAGVSP